LSLDASAMNCPPCRRKTLSVMDRRVHDASVSRAAPIQMAFR
jgi:3-polyprenyl-4-hydroxybenzoate decarboxylase